MMLHSKTHLDHEISDVDTAKMFTSRGAIAPEKVSVVPHGTRHRNSKENAGEDFRDAHNIGNATTLFVYVGALLPRKGLDILLDSWCQAFKPDEDVALIVKSSYSHGGEMIKEKLLAFTGCPKCGRIIHLEHWSGNDDLTSLYDAANIFVHPSRAEGFGLTPLEALGFGKLVVAPNMGASNDFLSQYYAYLVDAELQTCSTFPCDERAFCVFQDKDEGSWNKCETLEDTPTWHPLNETKLTEALKEVHENKARYQRYVPYGQHVVQTHFSWSAISKVAIYEMFKVWQIKGNDTHKGVVSSHWDMDPTFESVMNVFIEKHGARNISAAEYM